MRWRSLRTLAVLTMLAAQAAQAQAPTPPPAIAPPGPATPVEPTPPVPNVSRPAAPAPAADLPPAVVAKVAAALENALTLLRPGQIGLATIWDGNLFVQCRHLDADDILCEAAGTALQPSLVHLLTLERAERLAALAWTVDPHFGNYIHVSSADIGAKALARQVLRALRDGYGADLDRIEVRSAWVGAAKCPPRNGPRQTLAGSINDAPAMAATALRTCVYPPAVTAPLPSAAALFGLYGLRVKGEIERLIVNNDTPSIHLVLSAKSGYVQCAPDHAPPSLYCEAASADSMPALAKVLTPERVAQLHGLGFADPGRAPNYSRTTPLAQADALRLTGELLSILYNIYGYRGKPLLRIATEKGG